MKAACRVCDSEWFEICSAKSICTEACRDACRRVITRLRLLFPTRLRGRGGERHRPRITPDTSGFR
uniref:Uncharacterized protein n=1 Tax=Candidatus Kentrum sp. LFY TaxID=2126342 RepID=A0A450UWF3_9GAMM|nr:MAG: hypothetical protein BECKLFY1418B_GA0070995_109010 [Candidatus Kentron sp. LFY]